MNSKNIHSYIFLASNILILRLTVIFKTRYIHIKIQLHDTKDAKIPIRKVIQQCKSLKQDNLI